MTKNNVDRTTRLVVTLTIFGGTWFLLKGGMNLWLNTFTTNAYTRSLFTFDYIVSVIILTFIIAVTIRVLNYAYTEFKTYQAFNDEEERKSIEKLADTKFVSIFETIRHCAIATMGIAILSIILEFTMKFGLFFSVLTASIVILTLFILKFFNNKKIMKAIEVVDRFEKKISPFGYLIYLGLIVFFLGVATTLISINQNQVVEAEFRNNKDSNLEIQLKNIEEPQASINIINEREKNTTINLNEKDFNQNFVEVYENVSPKNKKLNLDKSLRQFNLSLNLSQYLVEGTNKVEIKVSAENYDNQRIIRIVNDINKDGSTLSFSQKTFKIDL
ncbi:hypothetical protein [Salibacterium sp. K-3]